MKKAQVIFQAGQHKWFVIARDPERPNYLVDTNEYLIVDHDEALLTDPGGIEIFPAVFSAISMEFNPANIHHLFASHQDPDIISSLSLWLDFNPEMRCYVSRLWCSFIPHFGGNDKTLIPIPDKGETFMLGRQALQTIPAHYLHSSGNFNLYDPEAKILFSGDIGAALLPPDNQPLFVSDFDSHIRFAEGFHRRWMGSNEAKRQWCERVSRLQIDMLCPQHGSIFTGADVERFIHWFDELHVGMLDV